MSIVVRFKSFFHGARRQINLHTKYRDKLKKEKRKNPKQSIWHKIKKNNNFISIKNFVLFVLEYGVLSTLIMWGALNMTPSLKNIVGFGLIWYFIFFVPRFVYISWKGREE